MQETVLSGPLILAAFVAVIAGVASFFSPCSLPLVPGYLSYVAGVSGHEHDADGQRSGPAGPRRARTVLGAALFVAGFAVVFTSYGALFGALGAQLLRQQDLIIRASGVLTIGLGLVFAFSGAHVPFLGRTMRLKYRPGIGLLGAPMLGVVFGVGWTPCIGPALAAVLMLSTSSATAGRGAVLALAYSLGLGVPFLLAAATYATTLRRFAWASRRAPTIARAGGAFLVALGVLQLSGAWSGLLAASQNLINNWQPSI